MLVDLPLNEQEIAFVTQQAKQQGVTTSDFVASVIRNQLPFYYDIEQMDKALSAQRVKMPNNQTDQEFLDWVASFKNNKVVEQ